MIVVEGHVVVRRHMPRHRGPEVGDEVLDRLEGEGIAPRALPKEEESRQGLPVDVLRREDEHPPDDEALLKALNARPSVLLSADGSHLLAEFSAGVVTSDGTVLDCPIDLLLRTRSDVDLSTKGLGERHGGRRDAAANTDGA